MIQNQFAKWVIKNVSQLNLKVQEATWAREWLPNYYNIYTTIEVSGTKITGHGLDRSKELAFLKASGEAIERALCIENNLHSTGIAAYPTIEGARERAANELKERDAFLCHYLTNVPFQRKVDIKNFDISQSKLQKEGIEITALQMIAPPDEYGIACIATPNDARKHTFSSIIGLSYDSQIQRALDKAYLECLESTINFIHKGTNNLPQVDHISTPKDHKNLFLGQRYQHNIRALLKNINGIDTNPKRINIDFTRLQFKNPVFDGVPLYFIRATSFEAQNIFYGETSIEKLNVARLEDFKQEKIDVSAINYTPHCVG